MRYVKRVSTIHNRINRIIENWCMTRHEPAAGTFTGKYLYYYHDDSMVSSDLHKGNDGKGSTQRYKMRTMTDRIERYFTRAEPARLDILYTDKNRFGIWAGGYDVTSVQAEYIERFYATDTRLYLIHADITEPAIVLFCDEDKVYFACYGD